MGGFVIRVRTTGTATRLGVCSVSTTAVSTNSVSTNCVSTTGGLVSGGLVSGGLVSGGLGNRTVSGRTETRGRERMPAAGIRLFLLTRNGPRARADAGLVIVNTIVAKANMLTDRFMIPTFRGDLPVFFPENQRVPHTTTPRNGPVFHTFHLDLQNHADVQLTGTDQRWSTDGMGW